MWYHYFFFPEGENEAQSREMLGLRSPTVTLGVSAAERRQLTSNLPWAEWSFLVGVIQPTSFSNFPPAGAVPLVFPWVAQQCLQHIGCSCSSALTPELKPYLPQACVQHDWAEGTTQAQPNTSFLVFIGLCASPNTRKDNTLEGKERKVAQAQTQK